MAIVLAGARADDEAWPIPASPRPTPTLIWPPSPPSSSSSTTALGDVRRGRSGQPSALPPSQAKRLIGARARLVVTALAQRDMAMLARLVHPDKGLRLSPYACVELETDLRFQARRLSTLMADREPHIWGSADGSGKPIHLRFSDYFAAYVYDRDFVRAPDVAYNTTIGGGNTGNNLAEAYPRALFVEYHFPASAAEFDWSSLRLVFEPKGGVWFLVGIVHDQWTI